MGPINLDKFDDIMFEKLWKRVKTAFGDRIRPLNEFTKFEKANIFLDAFEFSRIVDARPPEKRGNSVTAMISFFKKGKK